MAFLNFRNKSWLTAFVKIPASWSSVQMASSLIRGAIPLVYNLKWWYLMFKCFVRGRMRGDLAISSAPELSSKAVHWIVGLNVSFSSPITCTLLMIFMIGITCHRASDRLMYSLLVLLKAISVCNLDPHVSGHPASMITYPPREWAVVGSSMAVLRFQSPAKEASA